MYSIIIPTMWKCNRFQQTLRELSAHELVGEIILIDNTPNDLKIELPKLIHILEGKNTYVTAPWNKGAKLAKYDKLLILNDDIWMDWNILNILEPHITEQIGLIGLEETEYNIEHSNDAFGLEPIERRNGGWGCAIFVHKENYTPIPEEMKVWGQDDWLFVKARNRRKQNYKLVGYTIYGELSVTNNILDADPEILLIRENDLRLKQQYNLF
jgi:hypothetical protein